jgi:hypothetical protein
MGLNIQAVKYVANTLYSEGIDLKGSKLCILGNQYLALGTKKLQEKLGTRVAHEYYEQCGAEVVSIDINGKDGTLPLDLELQLPVFLENEFDVVINSGTTEHIKDQYAVFKNIHELCKPGALVFHMVPRMNNWVNHGYWSYTATFFLNLIRLSHYKLIDLHIDDYVSEKKGNKNDLVFVCMQITKGAGFPTEEQFLHLSATLQRK